MIISAIHRILFHRASAFIHDILWVPVSLAAAYWLRFNLEVIPVEFLSSLIRQVLIAIPIFAVIFSNFGLYRGIWKFASLQDTIRILKAVFLGTLIFCTIEAILFRFQDVPRSIFLVFPLLLAVGLSGPRLFYRWIKYHRITFPEKEGKRTLIVGAGHAAELLLRDLNHKRHEYHPIALIDDDPEKHNREIHGVRVYGGIDNIAAIVRNLEIELVLLAIPSATSDTVKRLVQECAKVNVTCRTLPSVSELTHSHLEVEQIRPITLEDLLGRETIELDQHAISEYLNRKSVLITGAGGSIGSELCRQVARENPSSLIIFDSGEFNLYTIDKELRRLFPDTPIITVLGDVKDKNRLKWVFSKFSPHVVFHAAAYKHVPMLELNPAEGVYNNVIGTKITADAADEFGVERFVLVSTDKAVNPANVMGATKRVAELYCQNLASRSETMFITTRFGNVLGSAGSVVPLFQEQIKEGGPVTVTHREIRRYFMTIPESVSLILQAGAMGCGGEIFVLDMGEPVLIKDLAEQMIRLSGLEPDEDIEIEYTGLRHGEKLFEEIFHESENLKGTSHAKLLLAQSRQFNWQWLIEEIENLRKASTSRDIAKIIYHLRSVVPEYSGLHETDKQKQRNSSKLRVVSK